MKINHALKALMMQERLELTDKEKSDLTAIHTAFERLSKAYKDNAKILQQLQEARDYMIKALDAAKNHATAAAAVPIEQGPQRDIDYFTIKHATMGFRAAYELLSKAQEQARNEPSSPWARFFVKIQSMSQAPKPEVKLTSDEDTKQVAVAAARH